jgi:excisionase family DNA binding protein
MTATATVLLSYPEAAERLHVSVSTARRLGRRGVLAEVRVSDGVVRVREESVDELARRGYVPGEGNDAA